MNSPQTNTHSDLTRKIKDLKAKLRHKESLLEQARETLRSIAVPLVQETQFRAIAKNTLNAITPSITNGHDEFPFD